MLRWRRGEEIRITFPSRKKIRFESSSKASEGSLKHGELHWDDGTIWTQEPCRACRTVFAPDAAFCHRCGRSRFGEEDPRSLRKVEQELRAEKDAAEYARQQAADRIVQLEQRVAELEALLNIEAGVMRVGARIRVLTSMATGDGGRLVHLGEMGEVHHMSANGDAYIDFDKDREILLIASSDVRKLEVVQGTPRRPVLGDRVRITADSDGQGKHCASREGTTGKIATIVEDRGAGSTWTYMLDLGKGQLPALYKETWVELYKENPDETF